MTVAEVVIKVEAAGVAFRLDGEKVHVSYPDEESRKELAEQIALLRPQRAEVAAYLKARSAIPAMSRGVRLVRWRPKPAPVAIDVCSVVVDVPKFIEAELRELNSRLNHPWTIRGGFTVPQMLDRLAQAGVEVELEPKGGASTTKRLNTEGGREIK
jgi:hypothetical protein